MLPLRTVSVTIPVTIAAQVLTLESLASSNIDDSIDPFTNKLLEFEVLLTSLIVIIAALSVVGRW